MTGTLLSRLAALCAGLCLAALPSAAQAHEVMGVTGFPAAILHPLVLIDHALALAAAGLFAGRQPQPVLAWKLVSMLSGMLAGFAVLLYVPAFSLALVLPLTCAALLGAAVAAGLTLPAIAVAAMLGLAGIGIGLNTIPEAPLLVAFAYAIGGAMIGAGLLTGALAFAVSKLRRDWQRIGVRIVGSWIAASSIIVLSLTLAR